jgi:hypothetical protein
MSKPIEAEYGLVIEQLKEMITSIENIDLLNFNDFSLNLNLTKLKNKQLINSSFNFSIHFYDLTENGSNWLIENKIDLSNSINILKVNIEGAELFLWEDFKKNNLRDSFHILCGHPSHDIYKVSELCNQIDYYNSLLVELNINLMHFCHYPSGQLSIDNMTTVLTNFLKNE